MPSWLCGAVEEQCIEWPDAESTPVHLSAAISRELLSNLTEVRSSDRSALDRRLRALVCDRPSSVLFVSERVGSSVVVQSLDDDPGGHAKLISCSSSGATVRYTLSGHFAVVHGARIMHAASCTAPEEVRTRSQAVQHGVQLGRPESEAAELQRWRDELRQSRERERNALERIHSLEEAQRRATTDIENANATASTARRYFGAVEAQRDNALKEVEVMKKQHSEKCADLRNTIKDLQKQLAEAQAQLYRAVHSRIETESHAAGRIETAKSKAESTVEELKRQMTSAVEDARAGTIDRMATLSGLADVLCPENAIVNIKLIDSLPMSDAATNEKSRRRGDYARVTSELCCALVQFAAGGDEARVKQLVEDVPQQLSWRRLFNGDFGASNYELRRSKHAEGVLDSVIFAYRVGKAIGNYQLSKQMLSLLAVRTRGGLALREVAHEATRRRELYLLDAVRVLHRTSTGVGRSWRDGVLAEIRPGSPPSFHVMPRVVGARGRMTVSADAVMHDSGNSDGTGRRNSDEIGHEGDNSDDDRPDLLDDEADANAPVCGGCVITASSDIRHCDDPYCTSYAVGDARRYGLGLYPGAPVCARTNNLPRCVGRKAEIAALFLRSADAVARPDGGLNTGRKGHKWLLKEKPAALLRNLNMLLKAAGESPLDPGHFYALVGTRCDEVSVNWTPLPRAGGRSVTISIPPTHSLFCSLCTAHTARSEYGELKMNTCCCALCRDLGYYAFELLRELIGLLAKALTGGLPEWCDEKKLLARVDEEERFYCGQFKAHLSEASSTAQHCRRHLLSPISDERFRCECDHERADGGTIPSLETQEARIRRTLGRAANSTTDWDGTCTVCAERDETETTGKMYCCLYCRTVIHKKCGIKHDRDDFPFDDDESEWVCATCAEIDSTLRHDSRCLECEGLSFLLRDLTTLAELAAHQHKGGENENLTAWLVEATKHAADLLRKYQAHKTRDSNQEQFQRLQLEMLSLYAVAKLSDWWGKTGHARHHTACCEFPQGGIGMHGSYYVFRNPPQWLRDRFKEVKWDDLYPPPPERGGPAFICEFHRSACNDATQGPFETGAVRLSSDEVFFSTKQWLKDGIDGETTDGCIAQYNSTLPMLYNLLNPFLKRKCTKESGEGKDRIDSNKSNDNPKIQAELNRKEGRLESASGLVNCVDKDRARGNVTSEAEFDQTTKCVVKDVPPIKRMTDYKFADVEQPHELRLWEFYSAELSRAAGKHVGLGPGYHLDNATLRAKHGFGSVKTPKATLRHNALDFKTGATTTNPLALLSHEQRNAAQSATVVKHADTKERISERERQAAATRASHSRNGLLICPQCNAEFQRPVWLKKHRDSNCGRHLARLQRRQKLINESVEKRLEVLDEAEVQEASIRRAQRSDTVSIPLKVVDPGWTLHAMVENVMVPVDDARMMWAPPTVVTDIKPGDRVRCSAEHFEADAKKTFGVSWRDQYFYGVARSRVGRPQEKNWGIQYDGEDEGIPCHFSFLERAEPSNESIAVGNAVVKAVDLNGDAARQAVYCGMVIVAVGDVSLNACAVTEAIRAGIAANGSVSVTLRRPVERRPPRGIARSANNRNETYEWHSDVEADAVRLANNPLNDKRDFAVIEALKAKYEHRVEQREDGTSRIMMPPDDKVKGLCKREWVKRKQKKKDDAQNRAAAAVTALERGGGGGGGRQGGSASGDDSESSSDDDASSDDEAPKPKDGAGVGPSSAEDANGEADVLGALSPPELRMKLRELGENATATTADLDGSPRTKQAEEQILRSRLRAAFAAL